MAGSSGTGHARVLAKQAAQPQTTADIARRDQATDLALRRPELEPAVWPLAVVMIDVLLEHVLEVAPATNDQPVEALATGVPPQPSA